MNKYCLYTVYRRNFADTILWQHRKIHRSVCSLKRKCGFMLKSDIKSCPSATDPFFQARCATVKEVSGVLSASQIVALREASLVPGYVRKAQLVLTSEIST